VRAGIRCELISWVRFHDLARQLALAIQGAGFQPEVIVAIGRGGRCPHALFRITSMCLILPKSGLNTTTVSTRSGWPVSARYPLAAETAGKRVLLVDDVSDSGDTFEAAVQHIRDRGEPGEFRTAVMHLKTVSRFTPDFYSEVVNEWHWIIYPWAVMEDLGSFLREMDTPPPRRSATLQTFCASSTGSRQMSKFSRMS
jgi:hypoxanthine phosphoribosyltransferase